MVCLLQTHRELLSTDLTILRAIFVRGETLDRPDIWTP